MHESKSVGQLKPLVNLNAMAVLHGLPNKPSQLSLSPASSALGNIKPLSASASLPRLQPLVNFSASSALEELMKAKPSSSLSPASGPVRSLPDEPDNLSPASLALYHTTNTSSPATAALDAVWKISTSSSATTPALEKVFPTLDDSLTEASRKRVKQLRNETPRRASMTSFSKQASAKFDTTDLFSALQAHNQKEEFAFPTLSWDNLDDDDDDDDQVMKDTSNGSNGGQRRKSLSASCLLGKRPRGGLVRSKTMKEDVDRLVLQHPAAFPCTA